MSSNKKSTKKLPINQSPKHQMTENQQLSSKKKKGIFKKQNLIQKSKLQFKLYYNLEKKLGEGSFGEVFKVVHKNLKQTRALKVIKKVVKQNFNSHDQLEILKKLDHPNILKIYQYFESEQKWYIITQFFEGRQLFDQIVAQQKISQHNAALIMHEILKPLVYIHSKNIAHRDIKAQNILIRKQVLKNQNKKNVIQQGYVYSLKLIDWGLGFLCGSQQMKRKCGTPQYCAPEVLAGSYTKTCDMWSVGVLLYIMLSGYMPFKGVNLNQTLSLVKKAKIDLNKPIWNGISNQAKSLIKALILKNPQKRLSAEASLKHPWILQHVNQDNQLEKAKTSEALKQTLERIKQFNIQNKFQAVIVNFIHNYLSCPKEEQRLRKQFEMLDENNDGVLSYQELLKGYRTIYGQLEAQQMAKNIFQKLDLDDSGRIQYSQFITFAMKTSRRYSVEQLREAFRMFDRDDDGLISKKQIYQIIQYENGTFDQELQIVIDSLDFNDDGNIDFDEFLNCLKSSIQISIKNTSKQKTQMKSIKAQEKESFSSLNSKEDIHVKKTNSQPRSNKTSDA